LLGAGVHAMLVGESLIRADDVGGKIRELLGDPLNKEEA
jgi:indole-3-glycerol phosphate synthase